MPEHKTMTRVLIIKTSSMGDIVHNLPVVADLRRAHPDYVIDWVVEEGYAELVRLTDGITRVLPIALRRWRTEPHLARTRAERRAFIDLLQRERYDVVLDTQGLLKSALIARRACLTPGGARIGFEFGLVRERLARLFYDRAYSVDPRLHAIERMRALAAAAFAYPAGSEPPRFELRVPEQRFDWLEPPDDAQPASNDDGRTGRFEYAVLLHATARPEKAWPSERWVGLITVLCDAGITPVLPSGTAAEREAAVALVDDWMVSRRTVAGGRSPVRPVVAPPLSLTGAAALLAGATVVVGVDTGLLHLAAALDVSTVGLFGATPRWRYAPYWSTRSINLGSFGELGAQPGLTAVVDALDQLGILDAGAVDANGPAPHGVEADREPRARRTGR